MPRSGSLAVVGEPQRPADAPSMGKASATLGGAMLVASAANYILNLFLARWMLPDEFGDANLMVTMMLATSAVAVALQLLTARKVSVSSAEVGVAIIRQNVRRAWLIGIAIGVLSAAFAPALRSATSSASAVPFIILGAGVPLYLAQAVERGALQGGLRFNRLALTFLAEAATRLVGTLGAVALGFGVIGATAGLTISFAASWAVARSARAKQAPQTVSTQANRDPAVNYEDLNSKQSESARFDAEQSELEVLESAQLDVERVKARRAASATSVLLVAQIIINNGDVVLAKMLFDASAAGIYAVVALIGRGVFFLSWSVVMAAFPLAAKDGSRSIAVRAVGAVAALSAVSTAGVAVLMPHMTDLVFGAEYVSASGEFGQYAVATSLFAVANVIATLELAAGRGKVAAVVLLGAVVQTAILSFASSPQAMVDIQIYVMAGVAALALAIFFGSKKPNDAVSQPRRLELIDAGS